MDLRQLRIVDALNGGVNQLVAALLVEHEATCLMLDCGFGLRDTVTRLLRLGRAPSDLAGILVTHEHGDHVNGVFRLARKFGLPVWMTHGTWTACREVDTELDLRIIDSHRSFSIGQLEGGTIEEIHPGDVVWFSPGEKHWHGAAPTTAMTHIAIQEQLNGKAVDWMEKVTDEEYNSGK